MKLSLLVVLSLGLFWACSETSSAPPPIKIATTPWPGSEYIYLAEHLGYFDKLDLKVELLQLSSLSDAQQIYINGHADGLFSTIVEAVQAPYLGGEPLSVVLIPDYSNGGDVILAKSHINSISDLRGQKVGAEVSSLGIYILARALHKYGMKLSDVELIHVEPANGESLLVEGKIDAFVTYPPVSIKIANHPNIKQIFNTSEIPYEIFDTLAISKSVLQQQPGIVPKLRRAWQMALDYSITHPTLAYRFMAQREQISSAEFISTLTGIEVLTSVEQAKLLEDSEKLESLANQVCHLLVELDNINSQCSESSLLFHP